MHSATDRHSYGAPDGLLIVWHSRTGTARALARALADGARGEGVAVTLRVASRATAADVLSAAAYAFVAPENLASLSGAMKEFFDRTYYPVLDRVAGRGYALVVAAGTDGTGVVRQVERIATGWRLRPMAEPMIVRTGADTAETILAPKRITADQRRAARDLGTAIGAGLTMGLW